MWYCNNCYSEFEEPKRKIISFEEYYGVDHLFPDRHRMDLLVCPNCGDDDIEEMKTCDRCGEWNREDNLEDTEELAGGGIGYLCPQCIEDCDIGE